MPAKKRKSRTPPASRAAPRAARKTKAPAEGPSEAPAEAAEKETGAEAAARTGRSLVIVESPAKAKTINKFLGRKFVVRASMGHVRDLPKSQLGVDVERGFRLTYQALPDRKHVLDEIRKEARRAPAVYLAPDPDREGEAIAWHLKEALHLPDDRTFRVTFNAITKSEVTRAFEHPRAIDMALVDAQQARRVLDRLVGYQVSPLLWKKVTRGLSAGRVQSVALGLVVDREREIEAFRSEPYWKVAATLEKPGSPPVFEATLERVGGETAKTVPKDDPKGMPEDLATAVASEILGRPYEEGAGAAGARAKGELPFRVSAVERKERTDRPKPPFTTATLQQQASIVLRYSAKRTMMLAQRLYEGIALPGEGHVALVTYMRTDSTRVAPEALDAARAHVRDAFGEAYVPEVPNRYSSGKKAQEAHEAVRPTEPGRTPESLRGRMDPAQWRLYDLIWRRFTASQMRPAVVDVTTADVEAGRATFRARGEVVRFDGHTRLYGSRSDAVALPPLEVGDVLRRETLEVTRHDTQPPPRYTEAGLVKALEQNGVGRPSTYATIISTIQDRGYVRLDERKFHATPLGKVVTDLLRPAFPELFRIDFTAEMEDRLDRIEEGESWTDVLDGFYKQFSRELDHAEEKMPDRRTVEAPADIGPCPVCGSPMVGKWSAKSQFFGCTRWPECKGTRGGEGEKRTAAEPTEHTCPKCGKPLVIRTGRRGRFIACSGYPDCKHTADVDEAGNPVERPSIGEEVPCEKCGKPLVLRFSRRGPFLGCSGFPKCRGTKQLTPEQLAKVPPRKPRFAAVEAAEPPGTPEEGDPVEEPPEDEAPVA